MHKYSNVIHTCIIGTRVKIHNRWYTMNTWLSMIASLYVIDETTNNEVLYTDHGNRRSKHRKSCNLCDKNIFQFRDHRVANIFYNNFFLTCLFLYKCQCIPYIRHCIDISSYKRHNKHSRDIIVPCTFFCCEHISHYVPCILHCTGIFLLHYNANRGGIPSYIIRSENDEPRTSWSVTSYIPFCSDIFLRDTSNTTDTCVHHIHSLN